MIEINNTTRTIIALKKVHETAERFLKKYKKSKMDISIAFIGDSAMRKLNKIYRGQDRPTDILTFAGEGSLLGEIIIDYAQIKRQARVFSGGKVNQELIFILVHGLFHLLGYEDDTEKKRLDMIRMGETFIKKLKA